MQLWEWNTIQSCKSSQISLIEILLTVTGVLKSWNRHFVMMSRLFLISIKNLTWSVNLWQADRFSEDAHNIGALGSTQVSVDLKKARSWVRGCEIQSTLQEQRYVLFGFFYRKLLRVHWAGKQYFVLYRVKNMIVLCLFPHCQCKRYC